MMYDDLEDLANEEMDARKRWNDEQYDIDD